MNIGFGSMAFLGAIGPASLSKGIGSSTPLSGSGNSPNFDEILAGFLGSGNSETIPLEGSPATKEKDLGVYGSMMNGYTLLYDSNLKVDNGDLAFFFENLKENLNEELEEGLEKILQEMKGPEIDRPEKLSLLKDEFANLLLENKILPKEVIEELFTSENFKEMTLKEKADFMGRLGRELMTILKDSLNDNLEALTSKLEGLRNLAQEGKNELIAIKPELENSNVAKVRAEKNLEEKNVPLQEEVTDKSGLHLQKNFVETLEAVNKPIEVEEVPEKVELRDLPKFIENQIKNSFKIAEDGSKELTVKIHPEHLGKMTLKIVSDSNQDMTVKIIAQSKEVKEFLDTNLTGLRNSLETSGIKNDSFNIEIDFDKGFNQFKESNQDYQGNSNQRGSQKISKEESFEEKMEGIFNNFGQLEVLA